jgi:hypothetical protein
MDWRLRSRPAYVGEYENEYPIPLVADSQEYTKMSDLPPLYPGALQPNPVRQAARQFIKVNQDKTLTPEQRQSGLAEANAALQKAKTHGLTAYTRRKVDLSGKGRRRSLRGSGPEDLPPRHKGSLKTQAQRFAQARDMMSHEQSVAQSFGDIEGAKMAEEIGDTYAKKQMETEKRMETVRTKGIASTAGRRKTARASGNGSIVTSMLTIRDQIKVYHWQTKSFARHKATDEFVTELDGLIDSFVEVYMGKYGRPKVSGSIKLHNFSESAAKSFVAKQTAYLSKVLPRKLKSTDTDLLNIRDEVLALVNKTLYLFTLQ